MNSAESHRTQNSRGPEADTLGQHRLRISAEKQFLLQPHQQKYASPKCSKLYQTSAMQNDRAEIKNSGPMHAQHESRERGNSPDRTAPEKLAKPALPGQTIRAEWPAFDSRHQQSWYCRDRKSTRLNSSHSQISYAVFCLKKKQNISTAPRSSSTLPRSARPRAHANRPQRSRYSPIIAAYPLDSLT